MVGSGVVVVVVVLRLARIVVVGRLVVVVRRVVVVVRRVVVVVGGRVVVVGALSFFCPESLAWVSHTGWEDELAEDPSCGYHFPGMETPHSYQPT